MFKCGICGKEFDDINKYLVHVSNCAVKKKEDESKKKEEEQKKLKEVNEFVENIKKCERQLESLKDEFAKKHPKEYVMNFDDRIFDKEKKAGFYGSVNGKECKSIDDFIEKLGKAYDKFLW